MTHKLMETEFKNGRVIVKVGDITKETTNAIVNAANKTLLGGGGVDRAIHRVGGKQILDECKNIRKTNYPNGLPPGEAIITSGGNLRTRFVIHTVGPIFGQENGEEERLLANSYRNSLSLAVENEIKTIAFPAISTGAFYFPKHIAAKVSSKAIGEFLDSNEFIKQINLVFLSASDVRMFVKHNVF